MRPPLLKVPAESPRDTLLTLLGKLYYHGTAYFNDPGVLYRLCPYLSVEECEALLSRLVVFKKSWRRKKPPDTLLIAVPPCYEGEAVHLLNLRLSQDPKRRYRLETAYVKHVVSLSQVPPDVRRHAERANMFALASWLPRLRFDSRLDYTRVLLVDCVAGADAWCFGVIDSDFTPSSTAKTDRPGSQLLDDVVLNWVVGKVSVRAREWQVNLRSFRLPAFATCSRCGTGLRVTRLLHLPGNNVEARCDNCSVGDYYQLPAETAAGIIDAESIPQPVAMPRKLEAAIVNSGEPAAAVPFIYDRRFARAREYREWALKLLAEEPSLADAEKPRRRYLDLQER